MSPCNVPSDSEETKFGSSNQEVSPSVGKNNGVVLVPYCQWECGTTAISSTVNIFYVPECHLLQQMIYL